VSSLAAGAGGGLVASIATCPLDVVKTKLQAQRATLGQADYLGISGRYPRFIIIFSPPPPPTCLVPIETHLHPLHPFCARLVPSETLIYLWFFFTGTLHRDCPQHHTARRIPRVVPRTRADHSRLSADVGDLLCRVRRDQDPVRRTAFGSRWAGRKVRTALSCAVRKGLSAYRPRAPVVAPHPVCHDSRRDQHHLHQSVMGHQDSLHGTSAWF
jgi:hypothetical protein